MFKESRSYLYTRVQSRVQLLWTLFILVDLINKEIQIIKSKSTNLSISRVSSVHLPLLYVWSISSSCSFVFILLIKLFKSCNTMFSDSIEISECFPQQQINKKSHSRQSLIDWLCYWCLAPTLAICQLGDIWTPQIANKCIVSSYKDRCNLPLTAVLWKEHILLLSKSSDRPSFVDILRRKIHTCTKCKMADRSSEWVIDF